MNEQQDQEMPINFQFACKAKPYRVVVREYMSRQYRLQLCKGDIENVVRECSTYELMTALATRDAICAATDPEAYLESLANPYNCHTQGARICLDAKA